MNSAHHDVRNMKLAKVPLGLIATLSFGVASEFAYADPPAGNPPTRGPVRHRLPPAATPGATHGPVSAATPVPPAAVAHGPPPAVINGGGLGGSRISVFIVAPQVESGYYSPYYSPYYYPPIVAVPAAPATDVEQSQEELSSPAADPKQSQGYWYYCPDSQTYYPYVQQCASSWQQVIPQYPQSPSQ